MQVARTRTAPINVGPAARIGVALAFALLLLATVSAAAGVGFDGLPASTSTAYIALFIAGFVASITLILPVPMLGMVFMAAAFLNPVGVALAAAAGISAGLWPTYFAGTAGAGVIEKVERSRNGAVRMITSKVLGWFRTRPLFASFLMAAIPNPLFDLAGVMAGAAGVPFRRFLIGSFAGKTVQMLGIALVGYAVGGHIPFLG